MTSEVEKQRALKLALEIVLDKRNEERYCFSALVNRETRERFGYYDMCHVLEDMLHGAPSVAVVRCGECVRRDTMYCPMQKDKARYPIKDDGFCYYGERKESGEHG